METINFTLHTHLGSQVRFARQEAGISQEELAKQVRLSRTTIFRIEKGVGKSVKTGVIQRLAHALGKPESFFFLDNRSAKDIDLQAMPKSLAIALLQIQTLPQPEQEKMGGLLLQLLGWKNDSAKNER